MTTDLRDYLRLKYGTTPDATLRVKVELAAAYQCTTCGKDMGTEKGLATHMAEKHPALERAFVLTAESGRTIITAPLREVAAVNQGFTYLRGRYVEADTPNQNGAFWTTGDLELGAPTVAGGPLNWLHQETKIIGALTGGILQSGREAADGKPAIGNHIVTDAVLWSFLYPNEAHAVARAAADGQAYYSMECLSRAVACMGDTGCGEEFDYATYNAGKACSHLTNKTSVRRFVDPYFLGGAVIVPPVKPGWSNADLSVLNREDRMALEAASLTENMTESQAQAMAARLLAWANR